MKPINCIRNKRGRRIVYKHKHPNFSEVKSKKPKKQKIEMTIDQELQDIIDQFVCYCTANRYEGVVSKYGESENPHTLRAMFMKDVHDDFKKDNPELYTSINKYQRKIWSRCL